MTHDDTRVVPLNTFVELDKNPNGSKKSLLKINDETTAPFVCVYVHFPVSAPDDEG